MNKTKMGGGLTLGLALLACACSDQPVHPSELGDGPMEDGITAIEEQLGVSCANASPVARFNTGFWYHSERTYNPPDCYKGQVVDWNQWLPPMGPPSSGGAPPTGPGPTTVFSVSWSDFKPATQAACEASVIRGYLFLVRTEGNPLVEYRSANGVWQAPFCLPLSFNFSPVPSDAIYRIAANARTGPTSGAATRRVEIRGGF